MARYKKQWRDGLFMGWDELSETAICTEATLAEDLGVKMPPDVYNTCKNLSAGETFRTYDNIKYTREW